MGRVGGGGQGGCERIIEVFVKIKKKKSGGRGLGRGVRVDVNDELKFLGKFKKKIGGPGGSGWGGGGGQDGCERRIEVFVKIKKKKIWGVGVGGDRAQVWGGSGWM